MSEAFLHWTADLDTGIEQVDAQHKVLVQYINEMHDAHIANDRKAVGVALDPLHRRALYRRNRHAQNGRISADRCTPPRT